MSDSPLVLKYSFDHARAQAYTPAPENVAVTSETPAAAAPAKADAPGDAVVVAKSPGVLADGSKRFGSMLGYLGATLFTPAAFIATGIAAGAAGAFAHLSAGLSPFSIVGAIACGVASIPATVYQYDGVARSLSRPTTASVALRAAVTTSAFIALPALLGSVATGLAVGEGWGLLGGLAGGIVGTMACESFRQARVAQKGN